MNPIRPIRSAAKLGWIVIRDTSLALRALMLRDVATAEDHLRNVVILIHDDLVQLMVALQRMILGSNRSPTGVDRILIVKLDRIGDMVNTMPVLDALRARFPGARLDVVGHPLPLSLLEGDDRVGEVIPYKSWLYHPLPIRLPGLRAWRILWDLFRRRYPLVVYLRGSIPFLGLGLATRLAAAKFVEGEPVIDRYLKPLEDLFGPVTERQPSLRLQPEARRSVRTMLSREGSPSGPRVAIHATASTSVKNWPLERFGGLADRLDSEFRAQVHFLGSAADRAHLEAIAQRARKPHAYHWSLSLPETAALIAECDLFIGNDSGLSHVAAALGTPMVVIWGPVNLAMAQPKAPRSRCLVLYHDLPCRAHCIEVRCHNPIPRDCLMRTTVADVLSAARILLSRSGHSERSLVLERPRRATEPTRGNEPGSHPSKCVDWSVLCQERAAWRRQGWTVVWTNGCFDLLHVGHVRGLQAARRLGDCLVVGLNSDAAVRQLKGPDRPIVPQAERAEVLAALECVDRVVVLDELTPETALARLQPEVHCQGADSAPPGGKPIPEASVIAADDGRVVFLPWMPDGSTSPIVARIATSRA